VGHDERRPIGRGETGAQAALPIWIEFMEAYLADKDRENPPRFEPPGNIVFVAQGGASDPFAHSPLPGRTPPEDLGEAFIAGTEPRP
jgi:penicillin-binding protein 1A